MSNLSKQKQKRMIKFIKQLKKQHMEDDMFNMLSEIENELNSKKYGLVWEQHEEELDVMMRENIPVFTEVVEREIKATNTNDYNFLLEGDNLHSLKLLEKTHKGKIDVIYIDPPYNTKNKNFIYNDSYIDKTDDYPHSKWLSFMSNRLEIARKLLSKEGVIFVSIDDNEQAQLKLLMDKIFEEKNYINQVAIKTKQAAGASGGGENKKLNKNIEYLLIYAKFSDIAPALNTVYKKTEISQLLEDYRRNKVSWKYTSVISDRGKKIYFGSTVDGNGNEIKIYKRENAVFKSVGKIAKEEHLTEKEVYEKYFNDIFTTALPQSSIRTRVMEKIGVNNLGKDSVFSIEYVPKSGRNKGKVYEQFYKGEKLRLFAWFSDVALKQNGEVFKKDIEGTLWDGINLNNLSKEGNINFDNGKKPLDLMSRILKMHPNKNSIVLDFFAGSGTTGHAVMQLNKEDGGNRKFILCTNNENSICEEVTYQRIKNVINGYGNVEGIPTNLKYYKTEFIPKDCENLELIQHETELEQLKHSIKNFIDI